MIINKISSVKSFEEKNINYGLNNFLSKIYRYISISLIISMLSALCLSTSKKLIFIVNNFRIVFFLVPVIIVYYMNKRIIFLSMKKTKILFFLFSISIGISISYIFLLFTGESVTSVFIVTSSIFVLMSYHGNKIKYEFSSLKKILSICIAIIIITTIVSILFKSSELYLINNILGTIIFIIFILYDTSKIRNIYIEQGQINNEKLAIYSSIILYINFINLFIHVLQIFGIVRYKDNNIR